MMNAERVRTILSFRCASNDVVELVRAVDPSLKLAYDEEISDIGDVQSIPGGRRAFHFEAPMEAGAHVILSASLLRYDEYDVLVTFDFRRPFITRLLRPFERRTQAELKRFIGVFEKRLITVDTVLDVKWYYERDFDRDHGDTWSPSFES